MGISTERNETMVIAKNNVRYKFVLNRKSLHQVVRAQVNKTSILFVYLRDII